MKIELYPGIASDRTFTALVCENLGFEIPKNAIRFLKKDFRFVERTVALQRQVYSVGPYFDLGTKCSITSISDTHNSKHMGAEPAYLIGGPTLHWYLHQNAIDFSEILFGGELSRVDVGFYQSRYLVKNPQKTTKKVKVGDVFSAVSPGKNVFSITVLNNSPTFPPHVRITYDEGSFDTWIPDLNSYYSAALIEKTGKNIIKDTERRTVYIAYEGFPGRVYVIELYDDNGLWRSNTIYNGKNPKKDFLKLPKNNGYALSVIAMFVDLNLKAQHHIEPQLYKRFSQFS